MKTPVVDGPAVDRCVELNESFLVTPEVPAVTVFPAAGRFEIKTARVSSDSRGLSKTLFSSTFWMVSADSSLRMKSFRFELISPECFWLSLLLLL